MIHTSMFADIQSKCCKSPKDVVLQTKTMTRDMMEIIHANKIVTEIQTLLIQKRIKSQPTVDT